MSAEPRHLASTLGLLLWVWASPALGATADSTHSQKDTSTLNRARRAATDATEQTVEVVRWASRRRQFTFRQVPYGVTGLPIFYLSTGTGWNYGSFIQWRDYRRKPYRYRATLRLQRSTEGKAKYYFKLKVPEISDTHFGVDLWVGSTRDTRARYYGLGNNSQRNEGYISPQSPLFRGKQYYFYTLEAPRFIFSLLRQLQGPLSTSFTLGLERSNVEKSGQRAFYIDAGAPAGVIDGFTGFVGMTLRWDTRDDEDIPRRGAFHEWSFETSRSSLLALFFEEIDFKRYTFTDARYWPWGQRLNVAHRTVFEILDGAVPLYAYGEVGGSQRLKGLGGNAALRGYDRQRFTDNVRFFTNTELRYQLAAATWFGQYLEWHGVLFTDSGRVWHALDRLTPAGLHLTAGGGLRLYWDTDFVLRLDVGFSAEQSYLGLKYGNIF